MPSSGWASHSKSGKTRTRPWNCNKTTANSHSFASTQPVHGSIVVSKSHPTQIVTGPIEAAVSAYGGAAYLSDLEFVDPTASPAVPNVLVILLDTLRRDHLGLYGYHRNTSPNIDTFAREAITFDNAISSSSWTRPAVASLFTSFHPDRHRIMAQRAPFPDDLPTLAEWMQAKGYHTVGVSANANIRPEWGFDRGFEHFTYHQVHRDDARAMRDTIEAIRFAQGRPWFAYVQLMGPHSPYDPPGENWDRYQRPEEVVTREELLDILARSSLDGMGWMVKKLFIGPTREGECPGAVPCPEVTEHLKEERIHELIRDVYDAEIFYSDSVVGELIQAVRNTGEYDNTLIVFLSDHGEELNDHGGFHHGHSLYDEQIRIPIIVKPPNAEFTPARIDDAVQIVDLAPTIADYIGVPLDWQPYGVSLRPALEGGSIEPRLTTSQLAKKVRNKNNVDSQFVFQRTARDRARKLIHDEFLNSWTFFDLVEDPGEQRPMREVPAGNDDLIAAIERMPRHFRPGYNLLIAAPRDRPAVISGTIVASDPVEPRFDSAVPDVTLEETREGWRFEVRTDPATGHRPTSPYFNPVLQIATSNTTSLAVELTLDGERFSQNRIHVHGNDRPGLKPGTRLDPRSISAGQAAFRGAAVEDSPRVFVWFWDILRSDESPVQDPELIEELNALGYV